MGLYLRGWFRLRRRGTRHYGGRQLAAYAGALLSVWLAIESPLDALGPLLLVAHMVQHLVLMLAVPVLLWSSEPELPLLAGLPRTIRREVAVPLLQSRPVRLLAGKLAEPPVAWLTAVGLVWLWHAPPLYERAIASPLWHAAEHGSFLLAGLVFWWPVIQPYPRRARFSRWLLLPYLFLAGLQGTLLAGLLTFSERVVYAHYQAVPRIVDLTPLEDQALAGAAMWIVGSLAYLIPLVLIVYQLLDGDKPRALHQRRPDLTSRGMDRIGIDHQAADHGYQGLNG